MALCVLCPKCECLTCPPTQLLLSRFWWNFKGRFLESSLTDANRYGGICPVNICPGNNSPNQEYACFYWLEFDQTIKVDSKKNVLKFFWARSFYLKFWYPKFFGPKIFLDLDLFSTLIFWITFFCTKPFFGLTLFWPQIFLGTILLSLKFFGHGLFLDKKFLDLFFYENSNNNNPNFNGFWHNWN